MRLDLFLARYFPAPSPVAGWSRAAIQKMIAHGSITLNGGKVKPSARLRARDRVEIRSLPAKETSLAPEPLALEIIYEDESCIVLNKPAGLVVHPAAGLRTGTLVNALLHHCPDLLGIGGERRPGIVHRLDKETSGVMVVAKHGQAFQSLARQFKERQVRKEYVALVWGRVARERGVVARPIGRHRSDRKKMSSLRIGARSREAATGWRVAERFAVGAPRDRFAWVTLLRLTPLSGRTHQIRVHLADEGYPVVGDRVYGPKPRSLTTLRAEDSLLRDFPRQALHAERLGFGHPRTGAAMEFYAPLPADMQNLLAWLQARGADKPAISI
ncbi:MAG: hypothetical protein A3F90_00135 [Deltaproteobacteria bacterium RIFCSPLOWO2_12_FULL_60_19]|nr:MAG: hypothetical protein A3F90_00135 [Deltaproteobacteria bacterium RIFCSPLOWO2_12_FULL_60_19]